MVVDQAGSQFLSRLPDRSAGSGAHAPPPAVQHRPAREHDGRNIHRRRRHQERRHCLVAPGQQNNTVQRISVKHFDKAEVGKISVERCGWALAGFLNRMAGKLEGNTAGIAYTLADALGEFEMMAVAGRQVRPGLSNADDWLAGAKFRRSKPVIHVALKVERGHTGIFRIVEPELGAQIFAARSQRFRFCL